MIEAPVGPIFDPQTPGVLSVMNAMLTAQNKVTSKLSKYVYMKEEWDSLSAAHKAACVTELKKVFADYTKVIVWIASDTPITPEVQKILNIPKDAGITKYNRISDEWKVI